MALRAQLTRHIDSARTGRLKYFSRYAGSLSGLQEIEPGWILCNGVAIPATGVSPAGLPYQPLSDLMLARLGSRVSPTLIDGRVILPRGVSPTGRTFVIGNNGTYPSLNVITLTTSTMSQHRHRQEVTDPGGADSGDGNTTGYGSEPFQNSNCNYATRSTNAAGGGGSHNNMPPYRVIGAIGIKL